MLKIGIIGRADNCGLGILTQEFYDHLKPEKIILLFNKKYKYYLDRFPEGEYINKKELSDNKIREFLTGLDLVLAFESPYNWNTFDIAREMGVKSVLIPMYEYLKEKSPKPNLYICPSLLDHDVIKGVKVFLNIPVNRERLPRRRPFRVKNILFNIGHGGRYERNSINEALTAFVKIKKDIKFVVNSQIPIKHHNSNLEVIQNDLVNYWDLYEKGDILLMPQKFNGLCLPVQEAMSCGLPVITTDMYPFNTYLPKELLIKPYKQDKLMVYREIDRYYLSPEDIAKKINEVADWSPKQLSYYSDLMDKYAEKISWKNMLPKYLKVFENLCKE